MPPEISVVIPTHNRKRLIAPTLAGALGQEDVEVEVIVVDDCSSDGTAERLRRIGDPRLRVLRHPENRRQAAARNTGIEAAQGDWVALLDDDDLWAPRKLRDQLDVAAAAGADLAFSTALVLDQRLEPVDAYYPPSPARQPRTILESSSLPAGSSNLIVRRELLIAVGGADDTLDPLSDWDLFIRLLLRGRSAVREQPDVGYVLRPQSTSAAQMDRHFADLAEIERRYRAERRRYGAELGGVEFSRWLAGGLRRGGNRKDAARAYLKGARLFHSPGNLMRALGLLLGERAMGLGHSEPVLPPPESYRWLDLYRPGGRFAVDLDALGDGPGPRTDSPPTAEP
jgi:glycosyltransferase involved in cell wall biosynthesis